MFFDETIHTDIVIAFYRALQRSLPEHMLRPVFLKCVQQYGEEYPQVVLPRPRIEDFSYLSLYLPALVI